MVTMKSNNKRPGKRKRPAGQCEESRIKIESHCEITLAGEAPQVFDFVWDAKITLQSLNYAISEIASVFAAKAARVAEAMADGENHVVRKVARARKVRVAKVKVAV